MGSSPYTERVESPSLPRLQPRVASRHGARALRRGALWAARLVWYHRLWLALSAAYIALGVVLVVRNDLIALDALSRSAHAYFVWANAPAKLSALGFAWGPMLTLPMLPLAAIDVIGRWGFTAMLTTAPAMAAMIVVVWRTMRDWGAAGWAVPAVAMLALHPMIVYYGANGMSEAWAVLLPAIAVIGMLRWHDTRSTSQLAISSFAAAAGVLARYELAVVPLLLGVVAMATVLIEDRHLAKARAIGLFYSLPTVYALSVWAYFNWAVQGSPVWFLTSGGQIATAGGTAVTVGSAAGEIGRLQGVLEVLAIQARMMPGIVFVTVGLLVWAIVARRWFAVAAAAMLNYNLLTNVVLVGISGQDWLINTRFNMRSVPLVVIVGMWLALQLAQAGRQRAYRTYMVALVAVLAAGVPTAVQLMQTARIQFYDQAFLAALTTNEPVSGRTYAGELLPTCDGARAMARHVEANVTGRNRILADDSSMFAVMMFSGSPDRFVDTIDRGSIYLADQLGQPRPSVQYLLVTDFTDCSGLSKDMVTDRFGPSVYRDGMDGLQLAHATHGFRLYRLTKRRFDQ